MPRRTASRMSSGRPTPIRYRGRSVGQNRAGHVQDLVHLLGRFTHAQSAYGISGKVRCPPVSRHTTRAIRGPSRPGRWRTASGRYVLPAARHRSAQRATAFAGVAAPRVSSLGKRTTWSRTMAMSLPSVSWISIARSATASVGCRQCASGNDGRVVIDLVHPGQAEHLKSAAVGQNRAVPTHERVQPTQFLHDCRHRAAGPDDTCCPAPFGHRWRPP